MPPTGLPLPPEACFSSAVLSPWPTCLSGGSYRLLLQREQLITSRHFSASFPPPLGFSCATVALLSHFHVGVAGASETLLSQMFDARWKATRADEGYERHKDGRAASSDCSSLSSHVAEELSSCSRLASCRGWWKIKTPSSIVDVGGD